MIDRMSYESSILAEFRMSGPNKFSVRSFVRF
jgi:hypothetical protein